MATRSASALALLVVGLFSVLTASNAWWLSVNELPDGFQNEAEHAFTLTEGYFRARSGDVAGAWTALWTGYYPPLMHAVAAVGLSVFGRSHLVAVLSLSVFLLALLGSGAALGRGVRDAATGALSVGLLATYPSVFGNARRYEPNIVLAGMVAVAIAWLILRGVDRRRDAVVFGLLCGLGMMADRLVFAIYLLPVVIVCLWTGLRGGERAAVARHWGLACLAALVLCGPFYVGWFRGHVWEVWTQIGTEITAGGDVSQSLPPWTLKGLFYYPLSFLDAQMGLLPGALTIGGLGAWLAGGRRAIDPRPRRLLEAAAFGGVLLITLIGKKQPFYSVPLLVPLAVVAAAGLRSLPRPGLRVAAVVLVLAGVQQLSFLTRGEALAPAPGRWSWFAGASPFPDRFLGYEYTQAWAPREQRIDLARAVDLCAVERTAERPLVAVFSDAHGAYEGQLLPAARFLLDDRAVEGITMSPDAVADGRAAVACFLYVTDGDEPWPSSAAVQAHYDSRGLGPVLPDALDALQDLRGHVDLIAEWAGSPDGHVRVYGPR